MLIGRGIGFESTAFSTASSESRLKSRLPVVVSKSTTPREKMSARASSFSPLICSGAMYVCLPLR